MNDSADLHNLPNTHRLSQTEVDYDWETRTVYIWMKPFPRACFNLEILHESAVFEGGLEVHGGRFLLHGEECRVENAVHGSLIPGIYNLGGDLNLFVDAIVRRDRGALAHYGHACVNSVFRRVAGYEAGVITYALVQGKAFGGGFECALASDIIVAEEGATFSFPEVLFNLIPGMGAVSLLGRRVGLRKAEELIMCGEVFTAREMYDLGVVDELAPDAAGLAVTNSLIKSRRKRQNTFRAMSLAKREFLPVTHAEMISIVEIWVDAALRLEPHNLRLMSRLARAQDRVSATNGHPHTADLPVKTAIAL